MPFKSKAQQRFMFAKHPKIAKRWAKATNFKSLPARKRKTKRTRRAKIMKIGRRKR